jgi:hypothetical protein
MSEKQREEAAAGAGAGAGAGAAAAGESEESKKVMVSPVQVLLGAIDLATTRGAFRIAELQLITQAYGILTQKPATEEQAQEQKESPIPELERAIQNAMGKN